MREVESDTKHVNKSTLFGKSESFTVTKVAVRFFISPDLATALSYYSAGDGVLLAARHKVGSARLRRHR